MIETLGRTLSLDAAYTLNSFQYHLRRIPLIKKLFRSSSYEAKEFKMILMVLAFMRSIVKALFFSALYYGAITVTALSRGEADNFASSGILFFEILFFLTLVGGILNNQLADGETNEYYAICMLRMNAHDFLLSSYLLYYIRNFGIAVLFTLIFCLVGKQSLLFVIVFPLFLMAVKFSFSALRLYRFKKFKKTDVQPMSLGVSIILSLLLIAAAVVTVIVNVKISQYCIMAVMGGFILVGIPCALYVFKFEDYLIYFKRYYTEINSVKIKAAKNALKTNADLVDVKTAGITSSKSGFAFMNELFLRRHHKMLMDATKIITIVALVVFTGFTVFLCFDEETSKSLSGNVVRFLPYLPFAFYLCNRGSQYAAALFANCDRCMLNYSFYRKRSNILSLFKLRLVGISIQNLYPAFVCGVGFVAMEIASTCKVYGASELVSRLDFLELGLLFTAPMFVSIFFSVHYLTLYYLLQPFDHEAKSKSPIYNIALGLTYIVCYIMYSSLSHIELSQPLILGVGIVVFCIADSILACILVYLFAPKTFKNRR